MKTILLGFVSAAAAAPPLFWALGAFDGIHRPPAMVFSATGGASALVSTSASPVTSTNAQAEPSATVEALAGIASFAPDLTLLTPNPAALLPQPSQRVAAPPTASVPVAIALDFTAPHAFLGGPPVRPASTPTIPFTPSALQDFASNPMQDFAINSPDGVTIGFVPQPRPDTPSGGVPTTDPAAPANPPETDSPTPPPTNTTPPTTPIDPPPTTPPSGDSHPPLSDESDQPVPTIPDSPVTPPQVTTPATDPNPSGTIDPTTPNNPTTPSSPEPPSDSGLPSDPNAPHSTEPETPAALPTDPPLTPPETPTTNHGNTPPPPIAPAVVREAGNVGLLIAVPLLGAAFKRRWRNASVS